MHMTAAPVAAQAEAEPSAPETSGPLLLIAGGEGRFREAMALLFAPYYLVRCRESGGEALEMLEEGVRPRVILADSRMGGINGLDFLTRARELAPDAVRMLMCGAAETASIPVGLGPVDMFLSKPCQIFQVMQAVRSCFEQYDLLEGGRRLRRVNQDGSAVLAPVQDELQEANRLMEERNRRIAEGLRRLTLAFGEMVSRAEDYYHVNHASFVARVSAAVAGEMKLSGPEIAQIEIAGLLHDLGKIGLPRHLRSIHPRSLPPDARASYETHVERGVRLLEGIKQFEKVREIIVQHHERSDGSGFPARLRRRQVFSESQIVAMADIYHNLVYRFDPVEEDTHLAGKKVQLNLADLAIRQQAATSYFKEQRNLFDLWVYNAFWNVGTSGTVQGFRLP